MFHHSESLPKNCIYVFLLFVKFSIRTEVHRVYRRPPAYVDATDLSTFTLALVITITNHLTLFTLIILKILTAFFLADFCVKLISHFQNFDKILKFLIHSFHYAKMMMYIYIYIYTFFPFNQDRKSKLAPSISRLLPFYI